MEIVFGNIILTIIIGFGLVTCGFFLGRWHWITKGMEILIEDLVDRNIVSVVERPDGDLDIVKYVDNKSNEE